MTIIPASNEENNHAKCPVGMHGYLTNAARGKYPVACRGVFDFQFLPDSIISFQTYKRKTTKSLYLYLPLFTLKRGFKTL